MSQPLAVLDPAASPLALLGSELRFWRLRAGLSQRELGRRVHASGALVAKVEKAIRRPQPDLIERLDAELQAEGALIRIGRYAERAPVPPAAETTQRCQHPAHDLVGAIDRLCNVIAVDQVTAARFRACLRDVLLAYVRAAGRPSASSRAVIAATWARKEGAAASIDRRTT